MADFKAEVAPLLAARATMGKLFTEPVARRIHATEERGQLPRMHVPNVVNVAQVRVKTQRCREQHQSAHVRPGIHEPIHPAGAFDGR